MGVFLRGLCTAWEDVDTGEGACYLRHGALHGLGQVAVGSDLWAGMCLVLDTFCHLIDFILAPEGSDGKIS